MASILTISLLYDANQPPIGVGRVPSCQFRALTGLPCPGCGLTRSFCAISRGQWALAWRQNPFGFVLYACTVFLLLYPLLRRLAPELEPILIRRRVLLRMAWLIVVPMWIWGLWRLWAHWCA